VNNSAAREKSLGMNGYTLSSHRESWLDFAFFQKEPYFNRLLSRNDSAQPQLSAFQHFSFCQSVALGGLPRLFKVRGSEFRVQGSGFKVPCPP
jgi:hypothetical protein